MTDSESDASDIQVPIPGMQEILEEGESDDKITDAAAAKSQSNGLTQSTPQQDKVIPVELYDIPSART
eukprot:9208933-Pyramimonas_sp.AAC.1